MMHLQFKSLGFCPLIVFLNLAYIINISKDLLSLPLSLNNFVCVREEEKNSYSKYIE